jgi:mgtE-like transporter
LAIIGVAAIRSVILIPAKAIMSKFSHRIPSIIKPDRSLLRQALIVLLFCGLIDLFPGYFLGQFENLLERVPGLLIILPPTVGLRGNIFGALAARLGSKLHLGTIEPKFRDNKEVRKQLWAASVQLLFLSALIPVIAILIGNVFSLEVAPFHKLLFISVSAAVLSGILMFAITFGITFISFKKGWDPDNVSAPIVASTGDILTIPILFLCAWFVVISPSLLLILISVGALFMILLLSVVVALKGRGESQEILRQALPIAMLAILISTFSGLVLSASFDGLLAGTIFLIMVPAFNGQGGSMGSVLGSRVTSAAYLGQHKLTVRPNSLAVTSSITLWLISLLVFGVLGAGGIFIGWLTGSDLPLLLQLTMILILGASLITLITSAVAYYIASLSFKMGLDPDNAVIPILTASMDVVGTGSLIMVLLISGIFF